MKKKIPSKKELPEAILESIKTSKVFATSRNVKPKKIATPKPYRSDEGKVRVPSSSSRVGSANKKEEMVYTGEYDLDVGVAYNKGGLQVLMKKELKDSGKKTSQLDD